MAKEAVRQYAKEILKTHGCDCYTYGGEMAKHIMRDLKEGYPDGMKFPYIDVANAILEMSRPEPVRRAPWRMVWDTGNCCDGADCSSLEETEALAEDTLVAWMTEFLQENNICTDTVSEWKEKQKEDWDYMIFNCSVHIEQYDPYTDEYKEYRYPSDEEITRWGWMDCEELEKRQRGKASPR